MSENKILLEVQDLKKYFPVKGTKGPGVQAVESVSLFIHRGETLGLVGESGCGKTTLGRTILRLHEPTSGKIIYDGETIFERTLDAAGKPVGQKVAVNMLPYRRKMQIIFQDPSASLDPRMTVGEIIGEALDIHKLYGSKQERTDRIKELLGQVGLQSGGRGADGFDHRKNAPLKNKCVQKCHSYTTTNPAKRKARAWSLILCPPAAYPLMNRRSAAWAKCARILKTQSY